MFSHVCFGVVWVAGQDSFLCFYAFLNDFFWVVPFWEVQFVPCDFEVFGLGSPAEHAFLGAIEGCGGHLYALVGFYAVEFLFVAWSVVDEGFVEPSASFDCRMIADEMVLLSFQYLNECSWSRCIHAGITFFDFCLKVKETLNKSSLNVGGFCLSH